MGNFKGFQQVKLVKPLRSTFDLSHTKRLSASGGKLVPVLCQECVPGDAFNGSSEMLVRLAPLLAPIYDNIEVYVHYFFMPNRLLWEDWETFITMGRVGTGIEPPVGADFVPQTPQIIVGSSLTNEPIKWQKGNIADYLGVPILNPADAAAYGAAQVTLDLLPFAVYDYIWWEYYRDRNFQSDEIFNETYPLGSESLSVFPGFCGGFQIRCYKHDYFTSALPFTQRGEEVLIPLDGTVTYLDQSQVIRTSTDLPYGTPSYLGVSDDDPGALIAQAGAVGPPPLDGQPGMRIENIESVSNATTTINDFRTAYALQVWMERNAVAGSRYTESIQAHFGIRPQDSRLQRPEYIGGGRVPIKISEVVATAWSQDETGTVPLGNMGGHGVTYGNTNQFKYFCTEHGFIMGILSIVTEGSYHQGLPRMFTRRSFLDYPWPTFAKLGEQEVKQYEIFMNPTTMTRETTAEGPVDGTEPLFGYQSRYADWKYGCNTNHGDFHDTLRFWTTTRNFLSVPVLSADFNTYDNNPMNEMFAVNDGSDQFWIYLHNKVFVKRCLPYFGTPNTLGFV